MTKSIMTPDLLTAVAIGFASTLHCMGMCGGIITQFSMLASSTSFKTNIINSLYFNFGRIFTYVMLGSIIGFTSAFFSFLGGGIFLRLISGLLTLAIGLHILNIWKGLLKLDKLGNKLWLIFSPILKNINVNRSFLHKLFAGMIWGLVPCGLVYTTLGIASSSGSVQHAMLFMLLFGLGTLVPLLLIGVGFSQFRQKMNHPSLRVGLGLCIILLGTWQLYTITQHFGDSSNDSALHHH